MKLLYSRVYIEETGFWPTKLEELGMKSAWNAVEEVRNDPRSDRKRVGIVRFVGVECEHVTPGMKVSYDTIRTTEITYEGKKYRQIREDDIWGEWVEK